MRKIEITKREEMVDDESRGVFYNITFTNKYDNIETICDLSLDDLCLLYEEIGKKLNK